MDCPMCEIKNNCDSFKKDGSCYDRRTIMEVF